MTETTAQLVGAVVEGIREKKGFDIVIADLERIEGAIAQAFVICSGGSPAQVEAIAEAITDKVRDGGLGKPEKVVGLENALWVAMDYTDIIVHIFLPDARAYYDLEHLWKDADIRLLENED